MEIATSIYLFLMSGMNFSLELSDYWAFSLVHAACKLHSVVVRITASISYLSWISQIGLSRYSIVTDLVIYVKLIFICFWSELLSNSMEIFTLCLPKGHSDWSWPRWRQQRNGTKTPRFMGRQRDWENTPGSPRLPEAARCGQGHIGRGQHSRGDGRSAEERV